MKNAILFLSLALILGSCSKEEQASVPNTNPVIKNPEKPKGTKMFIGVHIKPVSTPGVTALIVGYTNSDSSFTQSDSVTGPFIISSNMDKHTSTMSLSKKLFYFLYRNAGSGNFNIGTVNTVTGKYLKSIDLGIQQSDMIHLQFDEKAQELYFSMGTVLYKVDEGSGVLSVVKEQQYFLSLPSDYSAGASYLSHLIGPDRYSYIQNNRWLVTFNRSTLKWDTINVPNTGDYRSLVASPADPSILYSYHLIENSEYNIVKINLKTKAVSSTASQDPNCHILWFQARFHPKNKLYTCLPFEHQMFPYFISINVETGKTIKYPTPSHLGQCLLD